MACDSPGVIAIVVSRAVPTIVQGSDSFFVVQVVDAVTRRPVAFSDFEGATGFFPTTESGEFLTVVGSLDSAAYGKVRLDLAASGTASLQTGDAQDFQFDFLNDEELLKILVSGSLNVAAPLVT